MGVRRIFFGMVNMLTRCYEVLVGIYKILLFDRLKKLIKRLFYLNLLFGFLVRFDIFASCTLARACANCAVLEALAIIL
jgi:hypothetical protein